jgi:S1-C subfamily serine protease
MNFAVYSVKVSSPAELAKIKTLQVSVQYDPHDKYIQKAYGVTVTPDADLMSDNTALVVSFGSAYVVVVDGKYMFVTADHVVKSGNHGAEATIVLKDYKGNQFVTRCVVASSELDSALLAISDEDQKRILPETVSHFGDYALGDKVFSAGFLVNLFRPMVPMRLEKKIAAKVSHLNTTADVTKNIIVTDGGVEFGFSGGPVLNTDGLVIGTNCAVSDGRQIGFITGRENAEYLIEAYRRTQKNMKKKAKEQSPTNK